MLAKREDCVPGARATVVGGKEVRGLMRLQVAEKRKREKANFWGGGGVRSGPGTNVMVAWEKKGFETIPYPWMEGAELVDSLEGAYDARERKDSQPRRRHIPGGMRAEVGGKAGLLEKTTGGLLFFCYQKGGKWRTSKKEVHGARKREKGDRRYHNIGDVQGGTSA